MAAFGVSVRQVQQHQRRLVHAKHTRPTTVLHDTALDDKGRRVRNRPDNGDSNSNDSSSSGGGGGGGWDDFDPLAASTSRGGGDSSSRKAEDDSWGGGGGSSSSPSRSAPARKRNDYESSNSGSGRRRNDYESSSSGSGRRRNDYGSGGGGGGGRRNDFESSGGGGGGRRNDFESGGGGGRRNDFGASKPFSKGGHNTKNADDDARRTNMKALEGAGFCHLYGLASVVNALEANRRDFTNPEDIIDMDTLEGESYQLEMKQRERKPEAQFSPWLFVQEHKGTQMGRSADKVVQAERLLELAKERGIQVATVDKGVLNTLAGNRPHQGYVLRCGANLDFEPVTRIPHPDEDPDAPRLWLVLDEVVDPQNLGALLRSAYFLGGNGSSSSGATKMGILVCAKNSAPPSPTVSAASAGALELMTVSSTTNLPRTLAAAETDGFRIVGASASVPRDLDIPLYNLQDLPASDRPTLVVLGSEGHGLRNLVTKSCTELVKIPGAESADGVDSLNVSVTGGIMLWHFLSGSK